MKHLGIALLTLATVAAGLPAYASEPLDADISFRLGSALLAGDPVGTDLLATTAPEKVTALTGARPHQPPAAANRDDRTLSPYVRTASLGDDPAADAAYRLVAGVDYTLDEKTTLDIALGGTLEAVDDIQETLMGALGADFDHHSISLGMTVTF